MAERVYAAVGFRDLGRFLEYVPSARQPEWIVQNVNAWKRECDRGRALRDPGPGKRGEQCIRRIDCASRTCSATGLRPVRNMGELVRIGDHQDLTDLVPTRHD
jgi:hypothetical protein